MSQSIYPSWRYHRNGKSFLVRNPDLEPNGPDWAESPWPPIPPEVKLAACCQKLKDKFDAAWKELLNQHAQELKEFDAQWQEKVNECAALQAEIEILKCAASSKPAPETDPKPRKK